MQESNRVSHGAADAVRMDASAAPGPESEPPEQPINASSDQALPNAQPELDLGALRLPQNFDVIAGVKKVITEVPIKKPRRDVFIRTHDDPSFRDTFSVVTDKETGEHFVVHPSVLPYVGTDTVATVLQTAIDRTGNVFLWPLRLPKDDGRSDRWASSALSASQHASRKWVRVTHNMGAGAYDIWEAKGALPEPEWPDIDFRALLEIALKGRVIDSPDHPLVRRLQGLS